MKTDREFLVGVTTISNWPGKINEIDELNIKEIALFLTAVDVNERAKLYGSLEKTGLLSIPHVHLRDDCEFWELDYLVRKYRTKVFNMHPEDRAIEFIKRSGKYRRMIFLENLNVIPGDFTRKLNLCGGVCLDVSHWHDWGILQKESTYAGFKDILSRYKIGCSHISAIRKEKYGWNNPNTNERIRLHNCHVFYFLTEFDYLKNYRPYLAGIISIELENPLKEQLEVKKYLEKIINI